jgi:NAD(P)-dependent dehydrogenase (short-subunit alcohol dehydrogenase family)
MITLHEKVDVDRPLAEVFRYIGDFRTTVEWDSTAVEAHKLTPGPVATGTRFKVICRHPLGKVQLLYTLTRLEPGETITLHGVHRFFTVDDEIRLTETATGTRVDYRAAFEFKGILRRFAHHFQAGLERMGRASVEGLRCALQDDFPAPTHNSKVRRGEKLLLPAIANFTRFGYRSAQKHWHPMSASMVGKHVVITGANSGIGLATARRLAEMGATLTLVIRNESKALPLKQQLERETGNSNIHIEIADLSLMAEVSRLVNRLRRLDKPIDVLINNAGALFNPRVETSEGLEQSFALLLLSPYRLTIGLLPLLARADKARVINVVSGGMYTQALHPDRLEAPAEGYSGSTAYAHAKRALMVVTQEWARLWRDDNIVVNAMHPGWASTPGIEAALPGFNKLTGPLLRSPEQGADTSVWLAAATEAGKLSGELLLDRVPRTAHLMDSTRESNQQRRELMERLADYRDSVAPSPAQVAGIPC